MIKGTRHFIFLFSSHQSHRHHWQGKWGNRMSVVLSTRATEGAIWNRLLQPGSKTLSLEAAQYFIHLEFPPEDKDRMRVLASKARDGSLTAEEQEEIRNYERVG